MSKPGPKPIPNSIKKIAGMRRVNYDEPVYQSNGIKKPRGQFSKYASRCWDLLYPEFMSTGILTRADPPVFIAMCHHFGLMVEAALKVGPDLEVIDERGQVHKNPLLQVFRDNSKSLLSYLSEFGGTPSSRSHLKGIGENDRSLYELLWSGDQVDQADQDSKTGGAIDQAEKGEEGIKP